MAARVRSVSAGELALAIEHHGSTAVPGLAAKPIVDVTVTDVRTVSRWVAEDAG